ncbi:hypothetical protein EIP91_008522 [Steccherinum ochraceum]|uniref:AB hydrolase-1 domain-containing protein n=1 Tax=Steccherinum ochraceum TaxID=92696 RepID=A0A4R0R8D8_9APHY|nr:hypothetical protein EIP91_008522 [Steccherinum ochraceum]
MGGLILKEYGPFAIYDTGVPSGKQNYATWISIHGYVWHSGNFVRVLPLAETYGIRLVLLNRRGYPGTAPLTDKELEPLRTVDTLDDNGARLEVLKIFMRDRARELYDFLQSFSFVEAEKIPPTSQGGGLVVSGWSLGGVLVTAFLTHVANFPLGKIDLVPYIRYFVAYNVPSRLFGYGPPQSANFYHPMDDETLNPEERIKQFNLYITGYYAHGSTVSSLSDEERLLEPSPTINRMSAEDLQASIDMTHAKPGQADYIFSRWGLSTGLFAVLRRGSLFPPDQAESRRDEWDSVELRTILCTAGVWESPWGQWQLREEVEEARESGQRTRPMKFLTLEGANHYVHWDDPERLTKLMLDLD